jgi:hypothetical protein
LGNRAFLDEEDEDWQVETWRWFLSQFGGFADLKRSRLVLPTREFFPPSDKTGHKRAEHIFTSVKKLARISDWPCQLVPQPDRGPARVGQLLALNPVTHAPAGTFGLDGNEVTITYTPADVDDPGLLIATLAHELAHYVLLASRKEVPDGEELHEFATDLFTVYLGFGLFGASAAFNFSQHHNTMSQGWQWRRRGYLSERAWVFALAIFLALRGEEPDALKPFLKRHLFSDLQQALKYVRKRGVAARIEAD